MKTLSERSSLNTNVDAAPVKPNDVVDPTAASDPAIDPDFVPQDIDGLVKGITTLLHSVQPQDAATVYHTIKGLLKNKVGAALDGAKKDEATMSAGKGKNKVEEQLRVVVRSLIAEAMPKKQPDDVDDDEDEFGEPESGIRTRPATEDDPDGANFQRIAQELDQIDPNFDSSTGEQVPWSVSGAKQAVDKARRKHNFLTKMQQDNPEEFEDMIWDALEAYIKLMASSRGKGEEEDLTADDIKLMKRHPEMVMELDGFREFLHKFVRKAGFNSAQEYSAND